MAQRTHPFAATVSTKSKYRVTNWAAYNRALVSRGEVTFWIEEAVLSGWRATGGKGKRYSDAAILCALSLRAVFRMPLRQTQGFLTSLKILLGLTIRVPHYSTVARRAVGLDVPRPSRASAGGPVHLAIDSPPIRLGGLKVFGEGEWKIRLHGKDKRRVWRKLHLAVDTTTGKILAHALTVNERHDGPELPDLLARIERPVAAVYADMTYDALANHAAILAREARPVIPPRKGAAISPPTRGK